MNRLFVFYLFFITFNFTIAQPGHIETFGQSTNGTGATLMTNSNNALSGNGQRKIYHSDIDDTYHLVYESDGKIYYSRSTGGDNWGMPEIVSSSGDSYFPSIAIENDIVIVVWFEYLGSVGRIELRERSYGIWQPKVTVATFFLNMEQAIKPTVISHGFIAHVLWKDPDHNDLRFRGYDYSSDKFRGGEISVPNTNSDSKNPTIEMSLRHGPGVTARINLAWEEKGHIYYSRFLTSGLGIVLEVNKSQVSVNTEYTNHRNPSISVNYYDNPSIIWQAYAGVALEKDVLLHRISSTGISWNVVLNVFSTNESDVEPSLAGQPNVIQSRLQQTSWANDANQLWVGHYDGVSWTSFYQWLTGTTPNLSASFHYEQGAKMAYRTIDASPPYSILSTSNNLMNPVGIAVNYFRRGVVVVDTTQLSFQIGQVIANENLPINFPPLPDTLAVYDSIQWSTMFRTAAFPALGSTQLAYDLNFEVKNAAKLLEFLNQNERIVFFLEVVDDSTNQYLETIDSLEISHEQLSSFHGIRNIIYNSSELRNVFLRVRTVLPRQIPATYGMSELYILEGERGGENRFAIKKFDNTTATEVIPAQFVLDQNYPNPFNPTTDISFKLFNSNNVLLEVYDIQGRLVTTLVNENKTEGTYTVRWDGRNQSGVQVSTGIYFYKLNVGNSHLIKKMALTR